MIIIALIITNLFTACFALCCLQDNRRLNWLEQTRSEIDTDGPGFIIYNGEGGEYTELGEGASRGSRRTLRRAIDAAMTHCGRLAKAEQPSRQN